jgi:hypothetical protein
MSYGILPNQRVHVKGQVRHTWSEPPGNRERHTLDVKAAFNPKTALVKQIRRGSNDGNSGTKRLGGRRPSLQPGSPDAEGEPATLVWRTGCPDRVAHKQIEPRFRSHGMRRVLKDFQRHSMALVAFLEA